MPKIERTGPRTLVGQAYYEIEEIGCWSFCPDSDDASTPATQVHAHLTVSGLDESGKKRVFPPMVCRFHGPGTLDAFIEALLEHRTYVFGRRAWSADAYPEQKR